MAKKFLCCFAILLLINKVSNAQLSENFNDQDHKLNPIWIGDTSDFLINNDFHLQSNNTTANLSFSLVTQNTLSLNAQWEFWMRMDFNPSSANYIDTYLTASDNNLPASSNIGYFIRAGDTDDEISLYRRDSNRIITKIIDGENGTLDHSNNVFKIKVTRDSTGKWNLYRDLTGEGNAFVREGFVTDSIYKTSSWFGILIQQSSEGFFKKHFIDDIQIKLFIPDNKAPEIISATTVSPTRLNILFDEPIDISSVMFSDFYANNGLGMPDSVIPDSKNPLLIHLYFKNEFTNGYAYSLMVNGVKDIAGNTVNHISVPFYFYSAQQYDVIIDEIFADPSPTIGLPDYEWIELKNTSAFPINLKGWKIGDATGLGSDFEEFILPAQSFVIVCSSSASNSLSQFGNTIAVANFPSLGNEEDLIVLQDKTGKIIHAVNYSSDWYQNEIKKEGGWSLEMMDTQNPCSGFSNWAVCTDNSGGTPGRKNSTEKLNPDETGPKIINAFAQNANTITVVFNEPLDSLNAATANNYLFDNGIKAVNAFAIPPLFDKVNITLEKPITEGIQYNAHAINISDCKGNVIGSENMVRFGLAQSADSFDIVINEILFNPLPLGVDYIELYNRSNKIIDLNQLYISNKNSNGQISNINQITSQNFLLFPKDFIVISVDPTAVKNQYITVNPDAFIKIKSLPSFPDDEGNVIILNSSGNIIDEVDYTDKWHFALLHNTEGISLERINYELPSIQNNFHSAATSAGYGTPGYKNSQNELMIDLRGSITVTPEIFSPDNDGNDDFATINYSFPSPGYVANITIFDASGRPVRYLQKNSLSGIKGYYRWDGLDDKQRKLPQGIYIIYTEIFNKEGNKKHFKNTIVLARKNY